MSDVLVAELEDADRVVEVARRVRELGYERVEAFTPFPIHELDEALSLRRTRLPFLALAAGLAGASLALFLQWWTNAYDYPLNVGGRPLSSLPTDVPIVFETTVLFAAGASFAAVLLGGRLPRLHAPIFDLPGFERTTIDRFWIVIADAFSGEGEAAERRLARLCEELSRLGATLREGRLDGDRP